MLPRIKVKMKNTINLTITNQNIIPTHTNADMNNPHIYTRDKAAVLISYASFVLNKSVEKIGFGLAYAAAYPCISGASSNGYKTSISN